MKTQDPKQMPFVSENNGGAVPQKEYFTADEAMAFLEPRIRAMFRWKTSSIHGKLFIFPIFAPEI